MNTPPSLDDLLYYCDHDYVDNRIDSGHPLAPAPIESGLEQACGPDSGEATVDSFLTPAAPPAAPAPYRMVGELVVPFHYTYYHLDHLGSPRILTDSAGVRVQGQHFLPFGEEMPVEGGTNTRKFTGHERDAETGLDYMLARYYSAQLGRFLAVDPSRRSASRLNPQSWNRYSYSLNNPINFLDPDGQVVEPVHTNTTYNVTGNSLSQVAPQITKHSGFASLTTGNIEVKNVKSGGTVAKQADGSYTATLQVKSATVAVTTNTDTPNWVDSSKASSAAQGEWNRFSDAVNTHEGEHVAIDVQGANQLDSKVAGLSATGTGATKEAATAAANQALGGAIQNAVKDNAAETAATNAQYDANTNHGATQGAVLDVNKDKK